MPLTCWKSRNPNRTSASSVKDVVTNYRTIGTGARGADGKRQEEDGWNRMVDRDKVISELNNLPTTVYCGFYQLRITHDLRDETVKLLEEQKAKPLIKNERGWNCSSCGMKLIGKTASGYPCNLIDLPEDEPIHFCPMCGQEVKWEWKSVADGRNWLTGPRWKK